MNDLSDLTATRKVVLLAMGIIVGFVARVGLDGFGSQFALGVANFATGTLEVALPVLS